MGAPVVPEGELDIDGVIGIEPAGQRVERGGVAVPAAVDHGVEVEHAGGGLGAHADNAFKMRQLGGGQRARRAIGKLGRERAQHAEIVAGLELGGGDQRRAGDLVEDVLNLAHPIGRVDGHQNDTDPRRRELGQQPFGAVRRPNADAVAFSQAKLEEAMGQGVDLAVKRRPTPADALFGKHRRVALGEAPDGLFEDIGDRAVPDGLAGVADDMGQAALGGGVEILRG